MHEYWNSPILGVWPQMKMTFLKPTSVYASIFAFASFLKYTDGDPSPLYNK